MARPGKKDQLKSSKFIMKRFVLLLLSLTLAACTSKSATSTDSIAGYWSGRVDGISDTGQEIPPREVGILIIKGCTTGKVCGKLSEDGHCPGDIIFTKVDGNRYNFLSETASGSRHSCGEGSLRLIDLELKPDGTILLMFHNGITLTGLLRKK